MSYSMMDKRAALVDAILGRLALHAEQWGHTFYLTDSRRRMATRQDRIAITGYPCRYVEVRHIGEVHHEQTDRVYGGNEQARHRFRVSIDYQYADPDDYYETSSQAAFDDLLESVEKDEAGEYRGLLPYLRSHGALVVKGETAWMGYGYDSEVGIGPLDEPQNSSSGLPDMAHTLTFTITLI